MGVGHGRRGRQKLYAWPGGALASVTPYRTMRALGAHPCGVARDVRGRWGARDARAAWQHAQDEKGGKGASDGGWWGDWRILRLEFSLKTVFGWYETSNQEQAARTAARRASCGCPRAPALSALCLASLLSVLRLDIFCLLCHLSEHLVSLSVTIHSLCMESRRRTWEPECRRGAEKKHDKRKRRTTEATNSHL